MTSTSISVGFRHLISLLRTHDHATSEIMRWRHDQYSSRMFPLHCMPRDLGPNDRVHCRDAFASATFLSLLRRWKILPTKCTSRWHKGADTRSKNLYQKLAPHITQLYSYKFVAVPEIIFKHSRPIKPHNFGHVHRHASFSDASFFV